MKECLVIALVLSLTGTVMGQQPKERKAFDNSRTDSSRIPRSFNGRDEATPKADPNDQIMKLDINSNMIDAIKRGETLEASIELKDVTNGIVMFFDDPTTLKPRVDEVPRNLKPDFMSGNGVLHFTVDEAGLERLKSEGLQYSYNPGEKGTYEKVSLTYKPSGSGRSLITDSGLKNDSLSSSTNNSFNSFHHDSSYPDESRDYRARTLDTETSENDLKRDDFSHSPARPDRDFTSDAPQLNSNRYLENQRAIARQQELDRQRNLQIGRERLLSQTDSDHDFQQRDPNSGWDSNRSRVTADNRHTHKFELSDDEIDALASSTEQIRKERLQREAELERLQLEKLTAENEARQERAQRLRLQNELRDRELRAQIQPPQRRELGEDEFYTSSSRSNLSPVFDRLPRTASLDPHLTGQFDSSIASKSQRLELQHASLENERLRLQLARLEEDKNTLANHYERRLDNLGNSLVDNTARRSPPQMSDYGLSIPGSQRPPQNRVASANVPAHATAATGTHLTTTAVDHILRSYDGTNFEQVANRVKGEVAAISAAKNRVDKFNGFLLFLFITFFALSLYLGWLAQTFYGQYGELADELRETFTATV